MNKIACAALLLAVSLQAQTGPAVQGTAKSEVASQGQAKATVAESPLREYPIDVEVVKKLIDLGYSYSVQPTFTAVAPTRCAIPLQPIPVPDKERSASKTAPANPSIDPKIVSAPLLPGCEQSVVLPTITVPKPAADKKADEK